ncbi:MAG: hypothetical protein A2135_00315 [Actinobacteria bacterium RBG_16_67_15]|nr:MAG: hypothetical protein A2135_00315 [Actinobacteria bacterium RBG_16_67_15]
MKLRDLESFVAVVETGTFLAAARRLAVSQPALWKRVKQLESELGVALFERIGRRVRPTPAGLVLAEEARSVLTSAGRVAERADALSRGTAGVVRIVCAPPHLTQLSGVLAAFIADHPGVDISVSEQGVIDAAAIMAAGTADMVTGLATPGLEPGFPWYDAAVVAVGTMGRTSIVDVAELRDVGVLVAPVGFHSRAAFDTACLAAGFTPRIVLESGNPAALVALAEAGAGVAVVADDALPIGDRGRHPTIKGPEGSLVRTVWCFWHPGNLAAEHLVEAIRPRRSGRRTH